MDKCTIVIVADNMSYLTNSLADRFVKQNSNIKVIQTKLDVKELSKIDEDVTAFFIYAEENISEYMQALVFIKDRAVEEDAFIFMTGGSEETARIESVIPSHLIKKNFPRPINVAEVTDFVISYIEQNGTYKKKKILVVDDSATMLRNVKGWLESKYHVSLANSAATAMKSIAQNTPDLILLDYEMPIVDGKQVLAMIRAEHDTEKIPVIFLTGKDDKESIMSVMALKPNGYLLKSLPPMEIVKSIDEFFEKQKMKEVM